MCVLQTSERGSRDNELGSGVLVTTQQINEWLNDEVLLVPDGTVNSLAAGMLAGAV